MITSRPLPADRIASWWTAQNRMYAGDLAASGRDQRFIDDELARSTRLFFPDGRLAEHHRVVEILVDDAVAGTVWSGPLSPDQANPEESGRPIWYVYSIEVDPAFRGRGAGRAGMVEAERAARETGSDAISLGVRADNAVARGLYESLGYVVAEDNGTRLRLTKRLD